TTRMGVGCRRRDSSRAHQPSPPMLKHAAVVASFAVIAVSTTPLLEAQLARPVEVSGVPALNFDADEGFGYGALLALYKYEPGSTAYTWTVQPTLFLTTHGRRDYAVFFDSPSTAKRAWRVTAYAGRE